MSINKTICNLQDIVNNGGQNITAEHIQAVASAIKYLREHTQCILDAWVNLASKSEVSEHEHIR